MVQAKGRSIGRGGVGSTHGAIMVDVSLSLLCVLFFLLLLTSFWVTFCFVASLWNILLNGLDKQNHSSAYDT